MEIKKVSKTQTRLFPTVTGKALPLLKIVFQNIFIFQKISESFKNTSPLRKVDYHN